MVVVYVRVRVCVALYIFGGSFSCLGANRCWELVPKQHRRRALVKRCVAGVPGLHLGGAQMPVFYFVWHLVGKFIGRGD